MQTTEIVSLKLPDFWASALVNGDYSSFSYPEEYKEITDFIDHYKKKNWTLIQSFCVVMKMGTLILIL